MNADTVVANGPDDLTPGDPATIPVSDLGDTVSNDGVASGVVSDGTANPADDADTVSVEATTDLPTAPSVPPTRGDGDTVIVDGVAGLNGSDFTTLPVEAIGADDYLLIVTRNGLAKARPSSASPATGGAVVTAGYIAGDDVGEHRALVFDTSGLVVQAQPFSGRYVFAGISTAGAAAGASAETIVSGPLEDRTWGWVSGLPIFVTSNGVLTQIEPTSGVRHQVGIALSDKSMFVSPQPPSRAGATVLTVEAGAVTQRPLASLIGIEGPVASTIAPYTELSGGNF